MRFVYMRVSPGCGGVGGSSSVMPSAAQHCGNALGAGADGALGRAVTKVNTRYCQSGDGSAACRGRL